MSIRSNKSLLSPRILRSAPVTASPAPGLALGLLAIGLLAIGSLVACAPAEDATLVEAAKGERVENSELGIAVADVPEFFKVGSNEGATIELVPVDPQIEGTLKIQETAAETGGINLVAAVERHKADLEGRPDGVFKGQRELGSQLGTAFYSRGQYSEGGRTLEETVIFIVHPKGDRELHMVYNYPAGDDSKARLTDQLFGVLGELEVLDNVPSADAPSADAPSTDAPSTGEAGD